MKMQFVILAGHIFPLDGSQTLLQPLKQGNHKKQDPLAKTIEFMKTRGSLKFYLNFINSREEEKPIAGCM